MRGCTKCGAALGMRAPGPFVTILCLLQPPQQLIRPEPFRGSISPHHPVDPRLHEGRLCGLVIRGIFPPPPSLLQAQQKKPRPAGTGPRGDASPPKCGSRTRPAPTSLFSVSNSVSIRHREPPTYARVSTEVSSRALDR